jgi:hypothetical protein
MAVEYDPVSAQIAAEKAVEFLKQANSPEVVGLLHSRSTLLLRASNFLNMAIAALNGPDDEPRGQILR